jgi:adenylate kinase family enzyme
MKLEQREDDRPEKIKMRLREYNKGIDRIVNYYKDKGKLIEIDASPSIEEIHKVVVKKLELNKIE